MLTRQNVAVLSLLLIVMQGLPAVAQTNLSGQNSVRIGALYMKIDTRTKLLEGVEKALADISLNSGKSITLVDLGYTKVSDGLAKLRTAINENTVDIIVGPTESDLFVRVLDEREKLEENKVPMISPLITADVDLKDTDWFFRTNVGVNRRAQVMYDVLRKYWVRSMAVLHANTEFGRRAEAAFKAEVLAEFDNTDQYISESYDPPPNIRKGLHEILKKRPEAVGIFGEREDILRIFVDLDYMDERTTKYNPVFFTVLDARQIKDRAEGMYFVSVTEPNLDGKPDSVASALASKDEMILASVDEEYDDVKALAYDTMFFIISVLNEVDPVESFGSQQEFRQEFRDQFAAVLNGGDEQVGPKTGMVFKRFINNQTPKVYQVQNGQIVKVNLNAEMWQIIKFKEKIRRIIHRFGLLPVFGNLLILVTVIFLTTTWDLSRWYEGKFHRLLKNSKMYYLLIFQFTTAFFLYFYLAETGRIQYNSILMTVVIAMTPSALFRAKLLETPWSKSIGLSRVYDQILLRVNAGLMMVKYKDLGAKINIIAQYNSEIGMRSELKEIFSHSRDVEQKARFFRELEDQLNGAQTASERKQIYARQLLRRFDWRELRNRRLIPPDLAEHGDVKGPSAWVRDCVQYCRERNLVSKIDAILDKKIEKEGSVREFYKRKMNEVEGNPNNELYEKVHFLVWQIGFKDKQLRKEGLLPLEDRYTLLRDCKRHLPQLGDDPQMIYDKVYEIYDTTVDNSDRSTRKRISKESRQVSKRARKNSLNPIEEQTYFLLRFLIKERVFAGDDLRKHGLLPTVPHKAATTRKTTKAQTKNGNQTKGADKVKK